MKHKFNIGDKAVYIYEERKLKEYTVIPGVVEEIVLAKGGVKYYLKKLHVDGHIDKCKEKDLYTVEEALEYLGKELRRAVTKESLEADIQKEPLVYDVGFCLKYKEKYYICEHQTNLLPDRDEKSWMQVFREAFPSYDFVELNNKEVE